jgi:hypothetical protein
MNNYEDDNISCYDVEDAVVVGNLAFFTLKSKQFSWRLCISIEVATQVFIDLCLITEYMFDEIEENEYYLSPIQGKYLEGKITITPSSISIRILPCNMMEYKIKEVYFKPHELRDIMERLNELLFLKNVNALGSMVEK